MSMYWNLIRFILKVKQHRHTIFHDGELGISDGTLKDYLDNYKTILQHSALKNEVEAQTSLQQLQKVRQNLLPKYV